MATNLIQIKRTSVAGRAANSTTLTNPGELALNMTDGIMYSTNGTSVFEIGANNTNQRVSGTLTVNAISANGGVGTAGQVLSSNGTSAYWATSSTLNAQQSVYTYTLAANTTVITGADDTAATLSYVAGLENVFINGVRQISGVDYNTTNATAITLVDTALTGEVVQVVAWTGSINSTNVNAQFAWTNTHSFSNTVTLAAISANGSLGTAGQVLHSNGTATYWAVDDNAGGTVTSIATANGLSGGTITTTGTLGVVTGSTLTVNTTGIHVNTTNLSIATSQLTGDVALGTNTSGNYVATISNANGISGSSSAEGGTPTIGVVTGSTLTVNTTGIHVNSALSLTDLTLSGNLTVSGTRTYVNTTTLDVGDNIITLNADLGAAAPTQNAGIEIMRGTSANVQFMWDETNDRWSTNGQPIAVSSLVAAGAASGITTLAAGNTTITGFANVSTTLQVGTNTATFGTAAYLVANGNVGIGTSSPAAPLHVSSTNINSYGALVASAIGVTRVGNGARGALVDFGVGSGLFSNWYYNSSLDKAAAAGYSPRIDLWETDGSIRFLGSTSVAADATIAWSERMRIDASGNVGIANTAPTHRLSVGGTVAAGNTTITGFINATSTGTFGTTLMVGNTGGTVDATLHIKSVQGGNGRFLQFSPQGNSINALAIMASSNSSGGEQWWSVGSQNDDTFKIQKGVGFGGAGVSISNTGAITSADRADAFGYKGIPQNQQTSAYTLVMSDNGKHIYATAANFAITIPANSTTAFPIGAAITIVVEDQLHTIAPAAGVTLVLAGTGAATTGTRTLAQGAVATILKVGTDRWYISGAGVT